MHGARGGAIDVASSVSRQLHAVGDFVYDNLKFFLDFGAMPPANGFIPPMDMSQMGAARRDVLLECAVAELLELAAAGGDSPQARTRMRAAGERMEDPKYRSTVRETPLWERLEATS